MPTLHMEVEVARSVQRRLQETHDQISTQLQQAASAVGQLEAGAWQGQSAQEFYNLFQNWRQQVNRVLQELQQMATRLNNEINEWEQMAQRLG